MDVHDSAGYSQRVRPSVSAVADGIRHFLYRDDGRSLPALIHESAAGDLTKLVQTAASAQLDLMKVVSIGMNLSVTCAEDIPFIDDATVARETANTYLGDLRVLEQRAACGEWVRGAVRRDVHQLARSDAAVLLISGGRDPVAPAVFGERVAKQLPHSKHLIFTEASHGNWGACGGTIIAAFIDRGSADGLDVSCVQEQKPAAFAIAPQN